MSDNFGYLTPEEVMSGGVARPTLELKVNKDWQQLQLVMLTMRRRKQYEQATREPTQAEQ